VLNVIMKIATKLSEDEYDQQITPVIVRLFGNQDRALRVSLLDNLPLMIEHLSQKIISNQIFPQMVRLANKRRLRFDTEQSNRSLGFQMLRLW